MFAAVEEPCQHLFRAIGPFLIIRNEKVEILRRIQRIGRFCNPEGGRIIQGHAGHALLDGVEHPFFRIKDLSHEASIVMVDPDAAGRDLLELPGRLDQGLGPLEVKMPLWGHAADNAAAAHGHVGLLMGKDNGRTDGMIAAACRIGPEHADDHRDPLFGKLGMPEKGPAPGSPARIYLFLFSQLDAAAIEHPDQGNVQLFGHILGPEHMFPLPRDPCPGKDLVVGGDNHRVSTRYLA